MPVAAFFAGYTTACGPVRRPEHRCVEQNAVEASSASKSPAHQHPAKPTAKAARTAAEAMDNLKAQWAQGVSKMKTLGQERKEEEKPQAQSAADISREDLLQLTMKLGARLKAAEKAHREVAGRARDAERDRDVLKSFTANTVLGTPGVLDGLALDDAALMKLYGGRDTGGDAPSSAGDAQSTALKEALARALSARDSETARADSEASKRQNAAAKSEERIVSLELKLRDARRDADGAPEAMAGLEAAKRENAELNQAMVVLRRAAEDARSRLADAESRLRRSENTSVEDKNAHASRARQLQTLEREREALTKERDALQKTNTVQNDQIEAERQRHDEREAAHQRELACSRALGLAHAASLSARIAHLEASCAISKAAITAAAPARERAVAEALARAEADHTKALARCMNQISRRPGVSRRFPFTQTLRFLESWRWVVFYSISSEFGPRRARFPRGLVKF